MQSAIFTVELGLLSENVSGVQGLRGLRRFIRVGRHRVSGGFRVPRGSGDLCKTSADHPAAGWFRGFRVSGFRGSGGGGGGLKGFGWPQGV